MRNITFAEGEYYHIYNRGVEKRDLFENKYDYYRFLESMSAFNTIEPVGSLYELSFAKDLSHLATRSPSESEMEPLVEVVAYCLNPNHFHMILKQVEEGGISNFMKRVTGGYAWYFNNRYKRTGSLFQGPFRAKHINTNEYLLRLSAYVNLNDQVHQLGDQVAKYGSQISSWACYVSEESSPHQPIVTCFSEIIFDQFKSRGEYKKYAEETLQLIREQKELKRELEAMSFD